jgi:lysophospholipase L1-like esterase
MNNIYKFKSLFIIIISIIIIVGCAYFKSLKEGLTYNPVNNNNIVLIGDSVLNNSNYVPSKKSVVDILKTKITEKKVFDFAKDGATISDCYTQLDKIPIELNTTETYVFISAGGNDILNKRGQLTSAEIRKIFNDYMDFLKALRVKLSSANINILNLYMPSNPRYQAYKTSIDQWNQLIKEYSSKIGEMYNVINIDTLLTSPEDFVYDIEPSVKASQKIANVIYLTV